MAKATKSAAKKTAAKKSGAKKNKLGVKNSLVNIFYRRFAVDHVKAGINASLLFAD